jgi:hypothetical protein
MRMRKIVYKRDGRRYHVFENSEIEFRIAKYVAKPVAFSTSWVWVGLREEETHERQEDA